MNVKNAIFTTKNSKFEAMKKLPIKPFLLGRCLLLTILMVPKKRVHTFPDVLNIYINKQVR